MKLALVFLCAFVVFSHQQIQQRPRGVIWVSPYYSPQRLISNGYQPQYYNNAPYVNQEFAKGHLASQDNLMDENDDYQSRILASFAGQPQQNNARFFFNSNPFAAAMSVPAVISVVTTVASIVTCVPIIQFDVAAQPTPPTCNGRKKREMGDFSEDRQFPSIVPSGTLKLMPTVPSSLHPARESRQLLDDQKASQHESLVSSKDSVALSKMANADHISLREKRFFFSNNNAVTSVSTSYVFVPTVLTQTVNLVVPAPSEQCVTTDATNPCASCLPAGYIVCPA